VPALFSDAWRALRCETSPPEHVERTLPYRAYLLGLTLVPLVGLQLEFRAVQMWNGIIGAFFLPLLALALLCMGRGAGSAGRTGVLGRVALVLTLGFFCFVLWRNF
jgi:lipopolysaccharide export LptBFGC system permease protein LptF